MRANKTSRARSQNGEKRAGRKLEDMHNGRLTLKCILKKQDERVWTRFIWLRTGTSGWVANVVMNLHVPYDAVNF
jgi:hypothetical protein